VVWHHKREGVSLENDEHQNHTISNCVLLQPRSSLHINRTVTKGCGFISPLSGLSTAPTLFFLSYFLLCHPNVCADTHVQFSARQAEHEVRTGAHTQAQLQQHSQTAVSPALSDPLWMFLEYKKGFSSLPRKNPLCVTSIVT